MGYKDKKKSNCIALLVLIALLAAYAWEGSHENTRETLGDIPRANYR